MRKLISIHLLTTLLLIVPIGAIAQEKSPEDVYGERIAHARAAYRVAIAKQIRQAKIVEIVLLRFDGLRKVDAFDDDEERFPVAPYEATTSVISEKKLNASQSKELLLALASQIEKPEHEGGAFCHYPIHGVRVYSAEPSGPFDSKLIYAGSFCWVCDNFGFAYPDGAEWLDTNSKLQAVINKLLPVPRKESERFEKKYRIKPNKE